MSVKMFLPTFKAPLAPYTVFYMYFTLTSEMLLYISGYNNKKKRDTVRHGFKNARIFQLELEKRKKNISHYRKVPEVTTPRM